MQPTQIFLPGKSRGQGGLASYSPWDRRVGHDLVTEHEHLLVCVYIYVYVCIYVYMCTYIHPFLNLYSCLKLCALM